MSKEIIGNYMIMQCPHCKAKIIDLLTKRDKQMVRRKKVKCPLCGEEII
jgi:predicted Zn finger-like uncharacterized protein